MNILFDACVLYPTVMRELLLGVAKDGGFAPKWSDRIVGEWIGVAARYGVEQQAIARGDVALCQSRWPEASIAADPKTEARLCLPDRNDIHVLAAAINGRCPLIVTMNLRDFPVQELSQYSIRAVHPDIFLLDNFRANPGPVFATVQKIQERAEQLSGQTWPLRALMKKARLPRFGKALQGFEGG